MVKEGPLSILGSYFMYSISRMAAIRTQDAATAARWSTNELQTSLLAQLLICGRRALIWY